MNQSKTDESSGLNKRRRKESFSPAPSLSAEISRDLQAEYTKAINRLWRKWCRTNKDAAQSEIAEYHEQTWLLPTRRDALVTTLVELVKSVDDSKLHDVVAFATFLASTPEFLRDEFITECNHQAEHGKPDAIKDRFDYLSKTVSIFIAKNSEALVHQAPIDAVMSLIYSKITTTSDDSEALIEETIEAKNETEAGIDVALLTEVNPLLREQFYDRIIEYGFSDAASERAAGAVAIAGILIRTPQDASKLLHKITKKLNVLETKFDSPSPYGFHIGQTLALACYILENDVPSEDGPRKIASGIKEFDEYDERAAFYSSVISAKNLLESFLETQIKEWLSSDLPEHRLQAAAMTYATYIAVMPVTGTEIVQSFGISSYVNEDKDPFKLNHPLSDILWLTNAASANSIFADALFSQGFIRAISMSLLENDRRAIQGGLSELLEAIATNAKDTIRVLCESIMDINLDTGIQGTPLTLNLIIHTLSNTNQRQSVVSANDNEDTGTHQEIPDAAPEIFLELTNEEINHFRILRRRSTKKLLLNEISQIQLYSDIIQAALPKADEYIRSDRGAGMLSISQDNFEYLKQIVEKYADNPELLSSINQTLEQLATINKEIESNHQTAERVEE